MHEVWRAMGAGRCPHDTASQPYGQGIPDYPAGSCLLCVRKEAKGRLPETELARRRGHRGVTMGCWAPGLYRMNRSYDRQEVTAMTRLRQCPVAVQQWHLEWWSTGVRGEQARPQTSWWCPWPASLVSLMLLPTLICMAGCGPLALPVPTSWPVFPPSSHSPTPSGPLAAVPPSTLPLDGRWRQPAPKFPLHLWLAKPTLSSRANTVSHIHCNAR
jgi:hypothetical protein